MQKGLSRIGLGQVGWKLFLGWFERWVPHAIVFLSGIVVVTYADARPAYWSGCFVISIGIVGAVKNFLNPWICKPNRQAEIEAYASNVQESETDEDPEKSGEEKPSSF